MDKPILRSTLKKLRKLTLDRSKRANAMMVPQEMLDFLAVRAKIKPLYLLGRGFDDPKWIEGAVAMARKVGMHIVEGPMWNAQPDDETLPAWFRDFLKLAAPEINVFYVCRTAATADAVKVSFGDAGVSMDQEASLLGYPLCCVQSHYERERLFNQIFYKMVERVAKGDTLEMQRLLREDVEVSAETPEERAGLEKATSFKPALFTSFHMCDACAADAASPARQISGKYEALALAIDGDLASEIAANQEGSGGT